MKNSFLHLVINSYFFSKPDLLYLHIISDMIQFLFYCNKAPRSADTVSKHISQSPGHDAYLLHLMYICNTAHRFQRIIQKMRIYLQLQSFYLCIFFPQTNQIIILNQFFYPDNHMVKSVCQISNFILTVYIYPNIQLSFLHLFHRTAKLTARSTARIKAAADTRKIFLLKREISEITTCVGFALTRYHPVFEERL